MVVKTYQWLSRVASLTPLSPRIVQLILRSSGEEPVQFRAGQYAELSLLDGPSYPYSFASPLRSTSDSASLAAGNPKAGHAFRDVFEVEFHIARNGPTHDQEFLNRLAVDDPVIIKGPFGNAYYRDDHPGPILGLAGGSGLGSIKCIAEQALYQESPQLFYLYHGARRPEDLYLDHHLRILSDHHPNFHYVAALSEVSAQTQEDESEHAASNSWRIGTVCECVASDFMDLCGWKAYIAGPIGMVETARRLLKERGLNEKDMHGDAF